MDAETPKYLRYLHGPNGAHRLVQSVEEQEDALREGWQMSPVLTPEQKAAQRAAQIAAGEIVEDAPVDDKKPKRGK